MSAAPGLAKAVCTVHGDRPATARCPECRRFFCGECVTEHSGRLICASCLAAARQAPKVVKEKAVRRWRLHPAAWLQLAFAVAATWTLFYFFARFLGEVPDSFHDGTIWE